MTSLTRKERFTLSFIIIIILWVLWFSIFIVRGEQQHMEDVKSTKSIQEFKSKIAEIKIYDWMFYEPLDSLICNKAIELKVPFGEMNRYKKKCKEIYALDMFNKSLVNWSLKK